VLLASGTPRPDLLVTAPTGSPPASDDLRTGRPFPTQEIFDTGLGLTVTTDPLEPWTEMEAGWFGYDLPGTMDFGYGACPDRACPGGVISVSVGTGNNGAVVDIAPGAEPTCPPEYAGDFLACSTWQAINEAEGGGSQPPFPTRLTGASMDELLATWKAMFGADPELRSINAVQWAIAAHSSRLTAFVMDGRWIVSVTAQPTGGGEAAARIQERRLELFLTGIAFDNPPEPWPTPDTRPVTTTWLDLELTTPHWNVHVDGDHLFLQADFYGALFGPQGFDVDRMSLGSELVVSLGLRPAGSSMTVTIDGASFDDLTASIERDVVSGTTPRETSIDGHRMRAWVVPQHSIGGPLAWIAILEAGQDVYVFQEHYPLDAPFQREHVDTLLSGLRFIGEGSR